MTAAEDLDEGTDKSAFERGKEAGEQGDSVLNPFEDGSPDFHHFETGRKFGARPGGRSARSPYWQRRK